MIHKLRKQSYNTHYKTRISSALVHVSLTTGPKSPRLQVMFLSFQLSFCCIVKTGSKLITITVKLSCNRSKTHCKTLTAKTWSANNKRCHCCFLTSATLSNERKCTSKSGLIPKNVKNGNKNLTVTRMKSAMCLLNLRLNHLLEPLF